MSKANITLIKRERSSARPLWKDVDWNGTAWLVTLGYQGRTLDIPFFQGSALTEPPTLDDVVECILTDASYVLNGEPVPEGTTYEQAKAVLDQVEATKVFLGDDFESIVWEGSG